MHTQLWCLCLCLGLAAGALSWGALSGVGCVILAAWARLGHRSGLAVAALMFALGAFRGAAAADVAPEAWAGVRAPAGLVRFELSQASWPGARCELHLQGRAALRKLALRLPPGERCVAAAGAHLWVPARIADALPASTRHGVGGLEAPLMLAPAQTGTLSAALARRRARAWERTRGDEAAALTAAVGLGLRRALRPESRAHMAAAGLGHLLAISGLHVAYFAWMLVGLGRRFATLLGLSLRWLGPLAVAWIASYVLAMGASASACRAGIMGGALVLGSARGRATHRSTLLVLAASLMLAWEPRWIAAPGFQMSVVAMVALSGVGSRPALASWRVTWALAPIAALHFGRIGWVGVGANLVAIPLFGSCVLLPAMLAWSLPVGPLAAVALDIARPGARLLLDLAAGLAAAPEPGPHGWIGLGGVGLAWWGAALATRGREVAPREPESSYPGADEHAASRSAWMRWAPPALPALGLVALGVWELACAPR